MNKKIILVLFVFVSLLLFNSCDKIREYIHTGDNSDIGGRFVSEDKKADARMEQIISAIKDKDNEELKSLFSKKALNEANDFDNEIDYLFDYMQGDIQSWENDDGWDSSEKIEHGKKSLMIRFSIIINTDKEDYDIYVIDYNEDTINTDNEGVYMLEVSKTSYSGKWDSWQKRMRAGISIVE